MRSKTRLIPLEQRVVGNHVWTLLQTPDGGKTLSLLLIRYGGRDGYGYQGVSENMGPRELTCPLTLLDMATDPPNEWAAQWREKVRHAHALKKARPVYRKGQCWEINGKHYELTEKVLGGRRGCNATALATGMACRIPFRHLAQGTLITTEA